jgi:hypothetical protein
MSDSKWLWSYGKKVNMVWTTPNTITDELTAWRNTPHFSWHVTSIWMSSSLVPDDGVVMVVCRTGNCNHQTSLTLHFHVRGYMKNMVYKQKIKWSGQTPTQIFNIAKWRNGPNVLCNISSWISNIHSSNNLWESDLCLLIWHFWLEMTSGIGSWCIDIKSPKTLYRSNMLEYVCLQDITATRLLFTYMTCSATLYCILQKTVSFTCTVSMLWVYNTWVTEVCGYYQQKF